MNPGTPDSLQGCSLDKNIVCMWVEWWGNLKFGISHGDFDALHNFFLFKYSQVVSCMVDVLR